MSESKFINSDGGITIDRSEEEGDGFVFPPGSHFSKQGEVVVPDGFYYDEESGLYFLKQA